MTRICPGFIQILTRFYPGFDRVLTWADRSQTGLKLREALASLFLSRMLSCLHSEGEALLKREEDFL